VGVFLRTLALLALIVGAWARAEVPVPPVARVTDQTGTLSREQIMTLESRLASFEKEKGSQIAVLIIPTAKPETIEQYALRIAETWKLGRKGVDDGALLLVAKNDRELRIEVGYGLEGALPDAIAKRIIAEIIVPRFREGDFYGGIQAGVERMISVIEGEPLPAPKRTRSQYDSVGPVLELVMIGFVLVMVAGGVLRALFGRVVAAGLVGAGTTILSWVLIAPLLVALIVGAIAFLITLAGEFNGPRGRYGSAGGGGWGDSSAGGGGFSGGGGGFGGGGASGRW
jgi:uncharacterized protein